MVIRTYKGKWRGQSLLTPLDSKRLRGEKPSMQNVNRKSLTPGLTLHVVAVERGFSPRYGEFVIVKESNGTQWYSFSSPIMATFFGTGKSSPVTLPATVQIGQETSKNGRQYLTAKVA